MRCYNCPLAISVKPKSNVVICLAMQEEHSIQDNGQCEIGERIETFARASAAIAKDQLFDKTLSIIEKMVK